MRYRRNIDDSIRRVALDFILQCPSSIKKGTRILPVSKCASTFKSRGIQGSLLRTLLSQLKKALPTQNCYVKTKAGFSIIEESKFMENIDSLSDPNHEYIVISEHSSMSETESVFYYIRNAFAHGSFSVEDLNGNNRHYYLECDNGNIPKARMLLKESTLLKYRDLIFVTSSELKSLQKKKKIPAFQ